MPDTYTKEQIAYVKKRFTRIKELGPGYMNEDRYDALALLSALSTAERERDENERKGEDLCTWVGTLTIERDQATKLAKQLAKKVAKAEGRAKLAAHRAVKWCNENINDPNDITNPPRFDEYDALELRDAIMGEEIGHA